MPSGETRVDGFHNCVVNNQGSILVGNYISKIFGASPVAPLQDHMEKCYKAARQLDDFFVEVTKENWQRVEEMRDAIVVLEHEADDLKAQIRSQLPKSMFMPVSREDLLELVRLQD